MTGMAAVWRHHRLPFGWGRLNVYTAGSGDPMLCLHGLGGSGRYWAGLAPHLAAERTLIAPDLAGFGRSDKPATVGYHRTFHLEVLEGLLDQMGIESRLTIAGHSMGGVLGALLALRRRAAVEALALVATPFPRPQERPFRCPPAGGRALAYRAVQLLLPVLSPLVHSSTFTRAIVADYLRHTPASYRLTSASLIWDVSVVDELAPLPTLDARGLLLFSDEDRTIRPDSLERWRRLLPQAQVDVVPGAHQVLLRGGFARLARWIAAAQPGVVADRSSRMVRSGDAAL